MTSGDDAPAGGRFARGQAFAAAHLDDLESIGAAGVHLRPVRRAFGITAFGTNAYTADAGGCLIEPHEEDGGPEELYVVLRGRARFVVDDEELDAPAGTFVFARPPARRTAVAVEDATAVLAVGGLPGAHPPSAWEWRYAGHALAAQGRFTEAAAEIAGALDEHPDDPVVHYDLACVLALAGEEERARAHLRRAVELRPDFAADAREDEDLAAVRDVLRSVGG